MKSNPVKTALKIFLVIGIMMLNFSALAQFQQHLTWKSQVERLSDKEYNVEFICTLDEGWHVYSQFTDEGGPNPTVFNFEKNKDIELIGKVQEIGKLEKVFDELFGVNVSSFEGRVTFVQKVKVNNPGAVLKGAFDGQVCKQECILFGPEEFSISFNGNTTKKDSAEIIPAVATTTTVDSVKIMHALTMPAKFDTSFVNNSCSVKAESKDRSSWLVFLLGFLGGLVALLTPCVFPMVPLTVSFFTKGGKDKKKGIRKAITYGISIVVIYVLLGLIITGVFGSDALNAMSTNMWFNLLPG